MQKTIAFLCLLLVTGPATAATNTQPCNLERVASIDLLMGPRTNAIFVAATFNSVTRYLAVDTGGVYSTLSPEVARELQLPTAPSKVIEQNLAGQLFNTVATVEWFALGSFPPGRMQFLLHPYGDSTMPVGSVVVGTLAPNILRQYDVEFDFAAAKMHLFKPSRCISGPYWQYTSGAAIDLDVKDSGHIFFPMLLDGKPVRSALDTGMSVTTLRRDAATRLFDIDPVARGLESVGSLTGDQRGVVYSLALHTLSTAHNEISITNPRMHLMPDLTHGSIGERDPELILGLSMLKHLHVYIAYNREKLFVTEASGAPAVTLNIPLAAPASAANSLRPDAETDGSDRKAK